MQVRRRYLLALIFLCTTLLVFQFPDDPDLGLHLAVGDHIIAQQTVPRSDLFSFSLPQHPYVYHSWLSAVAFAWIYRLGGLLMLTIVATFVIAVSCFLVLRRMQISLLGLVVYLAVTSVIFSSVGVRPQIMSFLFFVLNSQLLFDYRRLGGKTKMIWLLPVIFVLWANSHAGFSNGVILSISFFILESCKVLIMKTKIDRYFRIQFTPVLTTEALWKLGVITCLIILATLITPYGSDLYRAVYEISTNPFNTQYNLEWVPLMSRTPVHVGVGALLFFYLALLILFPLKLEFTEFLLSFGFLFMGLRSVRAMLMFFILFLPLVSRHLGLVHLRQSKKGWFSPITLALVILVLVVFYRSAANVEISLRMVFSPRFLASYRQRYPYGAVGYLRNHQVSKRLLNHYTWGGYLLWQLPGTRWFETGIMDIFKSSPNRYFLADYFEIVNLGPRWQDLFDRYQIEGILVPGEMPIVQYVRASPAWEVLYEDEVSVLAVRKQISANLILSFYVR